MAQSFSQLLPETTRTRSELNLRAGDTVRVHVKIQDKDKFRIQILEGIVLAVKHGGENGGSFTVRKVSNGVGVERVFPLYSPMIETIEIVRRARTRRGKLYFIREKVARDIRRKMRNFVDFFRSSSDIAKEAAASAAATEVIEEVEEEVLPVEAPETTPEVIETPEVVEVTEEATETPAEAEEKAE